MAKRGEVRPRQVKVFVVIMAGVLLTAFLARAVHLSREMGPSCKRCRQAAPYDGLAVALTERKVGSGTVIAGDRHLAGNLRRLLPDARIVNLQWPAYAPPIRANDFSSTAVVVWQPNGDERTLPYGAVEEITKLGGHIPGSPEKISVDQRPFLSTSILRQWEWMVQMVHVKPPPN